VITKLDVLDHFAEIPVCVGYRLGGQPVPQMPAASQALSALEVVYETFPGWQTSTSGITSYAALPGRAKDYLKFLEQQTAVEIGSISTGPERDQTILAPGSKLERLLKSR